MLDLPAAPPGPAAGVVSDGPRAESDESRREDIGRAMERLLGHAPLFRKPPIPARADERIREPSSAAAEAPPDGSPAAELVRLAGELEGLDLAPERAAEVRRCLLALARSATDGPPAWELVSDALAHSGASPALARRALPLLLEFAARAA